MSRSYVLTMRCQDVVGIVAAVATTLANAGAFIIESSHFGDEATGLFFMRTVFKPTDPQTQTLQEFQALLTSTAQKFNAELKVRSSDERMKVLLAVSKHGHCLNHLLHQWQSDELPIDIVGVVSNHPDMEGLVNWYGIPYHHLPMQSDKRAQEEQFLKLVETSGAELTVLARYMQILSDEMCQQLNGRCINIHHSFLPSFKGAKPYHQAHARGVKLVGATAHYVTSDLDEGPIIEQETVRVGHGFDADAFVRIGKDVESLVLARAVHWHAEHRVMINGQSTVVFRQGA